jgi:hypothetical protein
MVMPEYGKVVSAVPRRVRHRWIWENITAGRINPLGLTNRFNTGYRLQIFDRPGALFDQSFFYAGLATELTPSFYQIGGRVMIQPLAVVNLYAQYEFVGTFGTFSTTDSFASPAEEHDDDTLDARHDANFDYGTRGGLLTLGGTLQAKVWRIGIRDQFQAYRQNLHLLPGDGFFYNKTLDIMVEDGGWSLTNDADLIFFVSNAFKVAARYTLTHAFYSDESQGGDINTPTHRVGPGLLYSLWLAPEGAAYNEVTLVLLAQWWAKHRYRTGADVHVGIPYVLIALLQRGDFFP